ncbi:cupin domain-containing protein [Spongiimicrobium sp. 3-5]|uniref:cupin domain-containing protein n=1 Tax=Spongiimicrobium sp. 3-5 TaxID=3332596 RepID=UPI00397E97C6
MNHNSIPMNEVTQLVKTLNLQPHPEGGYFRETYRSIGEISPDNLAANYGGKRNYTTAIYFLLTSDTFSAFHKIKQDEIWHFHKGSPIELHMISPKGEHTEITIGLDIDNNEKPQFVVPGGYWFAAKTINKTSYSLVGCTVSPGFDFEDFELPLRQELITLFPEHKELIVKFTRV